MEIENEFIMSQDGYPSIDFTLLDRPNNNTDSAPEATAVLLPDGHATNASFPSFELLDGSGVVGSYGYARAEGDDNQSLEQSRDGSEKELYKEQAMHSTADNGVAPSEVEYPEYQIPQSMAKPVSSVDFFAKNQAPQQQEQQSQLTLFGGGGGEENQEFFESGQASQESQPTGSSWWTPDNAWAGNNSQRDQAQAYNWAAMTEEQRRSMQLKMGGSQNSSEYPGALYSMSQVVNNDPAPSMYSFLPTNAHQMHKMPHQADGGLNAPRVQGMQGPPTGKGPQYDFQGLLNGSGYHQGEGLPQNMGLSEQQRYRAMMQHEASSREHQLRLQEIRNREQLLMQEASNREQQLREHNLRQQQQQQQLREQQLREQQLREQQQQQQQQLRMQEASSREQHLREQQQQLREQQVREQHLRMQEQNSREQQQLRFKEVSNREQQLRMQEVSSREQQLRMQGQQNQSFSKYDNQGMEVSPLKVSDYDFLGGAEYAMKGQPPSDIRQQLNETDAQLWRQQQQQQRQPRQFNTYGNNFEDLHQRQQAQVRQRLQQHAQQQMFAGNQNQSSGNQFQAFLGEGSIQDLPQVMPHQPERVNSQSGAEGHHPFVPPNVQALNQSNAGGIMYPAPNETGAGQGPINYLLGQDNSFSWHQLAIKASALDQPMHPSAANSSKASQQSNPYANVHDGAGPGFMGGMGKQPPPAAQINRPIPRSLGAGPSPLFQMEGRPEASDHQTAKSKMLFGQAMQQQQQQQQPPQMAKHMQGYAATTQQSNYASANRQVLEAAQRRHQQSMRGNGVQQDDAPSVKLFSQSLNSLDPIQQQQHNLLTANRNPQNPQVRHANILQQSALNMMQERNPHLPANPGHHYQQGVNQAGGSLLQSASDRKQQPMWNNYEMEPQASQVEAPGMLPGNTDPLIKGNIWPAGGEGRAAPDADNSLAFERAKMQHNMYGTHGVQPSNSQSSGDGSRHHTPQGGAVAQQGTPKSSGGHPFAPQANGAVMHQSSMMELSELEANGRQQDMQNSQEETNWRNHSLLQASPQQSVATNSSLQAFADPERAQTSWKSLWQSVQNSGNSSQLAEADKGQQLSGQGPSFQEALSQASLSDNDPSSASQHMEQGFQNASSFPQPIDRDGNVVNSSDVVGHSSSSKFHVDHQPPNLQNQGQVNAWSSDTRQRFNDPSASLLENSGQQEGRVQLQLSNQQAENRLQSLMNARASNMHEELSGVQSLRNMNAISGYGQQSNIERPPLLNGATEDAMAGWAQNQHKLRMQQAKLAGRPMQPSNMVGSAGKEPFSPSRPESAGDDQTTYTNSILAQRARYSGRRDMGDPGRNTLELLNRTEQGEEITEGLVDQDGSTPEDSAGPAATSLAHLRPGPMGASPLQRPTPSRPELSSREQMELQPSRNMEPFMHQGRNLMHDYSREEVRAYAQSQMQSQMPPQMQAQMQAQMQSQLQAQMQAQAPAQNVRAAQLQAEQMPRPDQMSRPDQMPRPGPMQERIAMNPGFLGANRHFPNEMSRQTAANIYKNLSEAAKLQFRQQLQQQQMQQQQQHQQQQQQFANQQLAHQNQRASAAAHSMDHPNMPAGIDPRMAAQQHMSRMGYPERPAMPAGMSPDQQQSAANEMAGGIPRQVDPGLPQAQPGAPQQLQQMKQAVPALPLQKKRKEYPPLVPWRTTITQGSTNLPTTSRAEMEWAAATNSLPDQERFNDAVESLDITAMCVKRAKRRLKFTTQLMQQLVPALPCQLFKGNALDDYKSATFVLAKFAVSEACWLSTGLSREASSGAVATEGGAENSSGEVSIVKSDQQVAVVSAAGSSKLRIQSEQKLIEFQDELSRLERVPSASKLSRELHDLDKLVVLNRLAKVHGNDFLAGISNPTGSPRGKLEARSDAPVVYNPETAYPERFVAAVVVPQTIPESLMLLQL